MIIDGHNDLVLQRLARRADGAPRSRRGARRRVRRRLLRALRPVAAAAGSDRDSVRGAAARADPVRGGGARRRGALRRALRAAGDARDVGRRLPGGPRDGDRALRGRRARSRPTSRISRTGTSAGCARSGSSGRGRTRSREGVPFEFPASPDTGPGLTAAGVELVRACNRLGILVDLSHLNEAGFWDVARIERRAARRDALERARAVPVVAEPDRRAARRGRADRTASSASTSRAASCARTGITRRTRRSRRSSATSTISSSGWGSTTSRSARTSTARWCPAELGGVAGLPKLVAALADRGYDDDGAREDHAPELAARPRRDLA